MKKLLIGSIIFIGISIHLSCSSSKEKSYFYLKGKISSSPITMQMHIYGHVIKGVYWYDAIGKPINFSGDDTTLPGSILLKNYIDDGEETIILNKVGSDFLGTWSTSKKSGTLKVNLKESKNNIDFDFYSTDSIFSAKIKGDQVTYSYSASMIWPTADDKFSKMLAHDIKLGLTNDSLNNEKPDIFLKKRQIEYIDQYKSMFDSINYAISMESQINIELLYQGKHYLSTHTRFYEDAGGAHGYGGDLYKTYDIESAQPINLSDVFTSSGLAALPRLIEMKIKKDRGLRSSAPISSAGLFEQGVEMATDNFYLTPMGIGFVYNPYEIAPFSSGPYDVFLSYEVLKKYLKPSFKK